MFYLSNIAQKESSILRGNYFVQSTCAITRQCY